MTLEQNDLVDFYDRTEDARGQSLEAIVATDPMDAYVLLIEESMKRGEINGLVFSPKQLDNQSSPRENMITRELRRRIPDPAQQPVQVEIRSWPADTGRRLKPELAARKVLSFLVGPLEPGV